MPNGSAALFRAVVLCLFSQSLAFAHTEEAAPVPDFPFEKKATTNPFFLKAPREALEGRSCHTKTFEFSSDGKKVFVVYGNGVIAEFDATSGQILRTVTEGKKESTKSEDAKRIGIDTNSEGAPSSGLSSDGKLAAIGARVKDYDKYEYTDKEGKKGHGFRSSEKVADPIRILDVDQKKVINEVAAQKYGPVHQLIFSPDNKYLLTVHHRKQPGAVVWDLSKNPTTVVKEINDHIVPTPKTVHFETASPDGKSFLLSGTDKSGKVGVKSYSWAGKGADEGKTVSGNDEWDSVHFIAPNRLLATRIKERDYQGLPGLTELVEVEYPSGKVLKAQGETPPANLKRNRGTLYESFGPRVHSVSANSPFLIVSRSENRSGPFVVDRKTNQPLAEFPGDPVPWWIKESSKAPGTFAYIDRNSGDKCDVGVWSVQQKLAAQPTTAPDPSSTPTVDSVWAGLTSKEPADRYKAREVLKQQKDIAKQVAEKLAAVPLKKADPKEVAQLVTKGLAAPKLRDRAKAMQRLEDLFLTVDDPFALKQSIDWMTAFKKDRAPAALVEEVLEDAPVSSRMAELRAGKGIRPEVLAAIEYATVAPELPSAATEMFERSELRKLAQRVSPTLPSIPGVSRRRVRAVAVVPAPISPPKVNKLFVPPVPK